MKLRCCALALNLSLAATGFGSTASLPEDGMFHVYENNRQWQKPNLITADFLLLSYSMILRDSIATSEERQQHPQLHELITALAQQANKAPDSDAVRANRRFLAVLQSLVDGFSSPHAAKEVSDEFALIQGADGVAKSPVLHETLDYTQFRPRGHYTQTPELSNYFRAVRYAETGAFYVRESAATGIDAPTADRLTQQAVLLAQWIAKDQRLRQRVQKMEERQAWLFGPSDDVTSADLLAAVAAKPNAKPVEWRKDILTAARRKGHQPAVFVGVIDIGKLESGTTAQDALTAWRLLPGSVTPDAAAEQQLVYGKVGKFLGAGTPVSLTVVNGLPVKGFPLANEIMALLGSAEAQRKLVADGDTNYEGYEKARAEALREISQPAGLPGEQLQLLKEWLSATDSGAHLPTALGFWTLCRHDSVLYAKQSYTAVGKGMTPTDTRQSASIEPATALYERLRTLSHELDTKMQFASFSIFANLLDRCLEICAHEKASQPLKPEEVAFLNGLDKDLLKLAGSPDGPIAVDVHTDLNSGQALEEALAYPLVVEQNGQRGARFHVMEFKAPINERLTDEAWQNKLAHEEGK